MRVVWTDKAVDQVEAIVRYISEQGAPEAACRVATSLRELGDSLRQHPWRGRGLGSPQAPTRELLHARWPYSVQYLIDENEGSVIIVAVWHEAQDTGRPR